MIGCLNAKNEERFNNGLLLLALVNFIKTSNSVLSLFRVEMRLLPDYNDYTPRKCGRKHFLFLRASGEEPLIFQIIVENEMKAVYKIQKICCNLEFLLNRLDHVQVNIQLNFCNQNHIVLSVSVYSFFELTKL